MKERERHGTEKVMTKLSKAEMILGRGEWLAAIPHRLELCEQTL